MALMSARVKRLSMPDEPIRQIIDLTRGKNCDFMSRSGFTAKADDDMADGAFSAK